MVYDQYKSQSYDPAINAKNSKNNPQLREFPYLLHYTDAQYH